MKTDPKDHKSCGPTGCGACPSQCTKTGIAKIWVLGIGTCAAVAVLTTVLLPMPAPPAGLPTMTTSPGMQNVAMVNQRRRMQNNMQFQQMPMQNNMQGNMQLQQSWPTQGMPMQSRGQNNQGTFQCQVCSWQTRGPANQRQFCPRCGPEMMRIG
ncbi:MAG: hypothetical protein ACI9Y8_000202 [Candidatus Omnitrophota bacterium]|jgi:hypothetical protein